MRSRCVPEGKGAGPAGRSALGDSSRGIWGGLEIVRCLSGAKGGVGRRVRGGWSGRRRVGGST